MHAEYMYFLRKDWSALFYILQICRKLIASRKTARQNRE